MTNVRARGLHVGLLVLGRVLGPCVSGPFLLATIPSTRKALALILFIQLAGLLALRESLHTLTLSPPSCPCEMKRMGVTCVIIDVWLLLFCACMICHSGLLLPRCLGVCALQGPWRAVSREPKVAFCADSEEIWNVERAGQGVSQDSCSPERPRVEACALSMRRVGKERATEGGRHARRREFGGRPSVRRTRSCIPVVQRGAGTSRQRNHCRLTS